MRYSKSVQAYLTDIISHMASVGQLLFIENFKIFVFETAIMSVTPDPAIVTVILPIMTEIKYALKISEIIYRPEQFCLWYEKNHTYQNNAYSFEALHALFLM